MATSSAPARRTKRHYVAAMVLGTALSALGTSPALATSSTEPTLRAITDISRYCTACWRNARLPPDYWGDCTQEVFNRLLERVTPDAWNHVLKEEGEERREFLRAIDAVKKRTQRGQKRLTSLNTVVVDARDAQDRRLADERNAVREAAVEVLTARQQDILQMSFEGWSVQDIAREMQLPPERVSDEKYKAIRRLREHLGVAEQAATS